MTKKDRNVLNKVAQEMYENAVEHGFHDGENCIEDSASVERMGKFISNLHSEASELWEVARMGRLFKDCDKTRELSCAAEELADIVIRAMDTAHSLGIGIGDAIAIKAAYNKTREHMHGKKC
jgi:NTP pyrophosphatase (non-canonical NTP hydrolase)